MRFATALAALTLAACAAPPPQEGGTGAGAPSGDVPPIEAAVPQPAGPQAAVPQVVRSSSVWYSADGPAVGGCPIFPADNPWNIRVDSVPVNARSADWGSSIGATGRAHPDFGTFWQGELIGIPFTTVGAGQPKVPVSFDYADESDPGPYPIPTNAPIEGGAASSGDRHVIVLDTSECRLYEMWSSYPQGGGASWQAGSINHALRFTVSRTQRGYIAPATHFASSSSDPTRPPMGARFRRKASYSCSSLSSEAAVFCTALKQYGMILADNGSNWYISGEHDVRWDDDALSDLGDVPGSAFEAVQTGAITTG